MLKNRKIIFIVFLLILSHLTFFLIIDQNRSTIRNFLLKNKIIDIAKLIAPKAKFKIIGIRPGEKLHEQMIGDDDANSTYEYPNYYKILPQINNWAKDSLRIKKGIKVPERFIYSSENNLQWMTKSSLKKWIDTNKDYIGKI